MSFILDVKKDFIDFIKKVSLQNEVDLQFEINDDNLMINRTGVFTKITGIYNNVNIDFKSENNELRYVTIPNSKKFISYLSIIDSSEYKLYKHEKNDIDKLLIIDKESQSDVFFDIVLYITERVDISPINDDNIILDFVIDGKKLKNIINILKVLNTEECGILFSYIKSDDRYNVEFFVGSDLEDEATILLYNLEKSDYDNIINTLGSAEQKVLNKNSDIYMIKYNHQAIMEIFSVVDKSDNSTVKFNLKNNGALIITEEKMNEDENLSYIVKYGCIPYL